MNLEIRLEQPGDAPAIRRVHEAAFGRNAEADLVDALYRNDAATLSLVAVQDGRIVGHILFSPVSLDGVAAVGLAPVAVLPEFQGRGIGARLIRAGLDGCRQLGREAVVVLGEPAYYRRFGFGPASRHGIRCQYEVPEEAFMALELKPGSLNGRGGVARYRPEFDAV
ncbi:MAG: N-acetyltransferase [Pseudomonadota bacterium]|nr:N-acetyltransferase [Pseudomonadota bacterium]